VVTVVFTFLGVVVKCGNVLFFAFHADECLVGVFWRYVVKCDWALRGLGFGVGFSFSIYFVFMVYMVGVCFSVLASVVVY
jgi:hypothetical protein